MADLQTLPLTLEWVALLQTFVIGFNGGTVEIHGPSRFCRSLEMFVVVTMYLGQPHESSFSGDDEHSGQGCAAGVDLAACDERPCNSRMYMRVFFKSRGKVERILLFVSS